MAIKNIPHVDRDTFIAAVIRKNESQEIDSPEMEEARAVLESGQPIILTKNRRPYSKMQLNKSLGFFEEERYPMEDCPR